MVTAINTVTAYNTFDLSLCLWLLLLFLVGTKGSLRDEMLVVPALGDVIVGLAEHQVRLRGFPVKL